jgi:hypothetical protein
MLRRIVRSSIIAPTDCHGYNHEPVATRTNCAALGKLRLSRGGAFFWCIKETIAYAYSNPAYPARKACLFHVGS